jgi:large subunit ribosomal protein L29
MKTSDFAKLSDTELKDKLVEESANYQKAKLTHAISPLENPLTLRGNRRDVARIKTELRRREIEGQA